MIELKVQCDCGQRYKFDVQPVNGRMPFPINCPSCGADGTEKANGLIRDSGHVGEILPVAQLASAAAPVAVASPAPAIAPAPSRLRISTSAHAASTAAPPPLAPIAPAASAPRPFPGMPQPATPATASAPGKKPNFWLGLIGGALGVFVGSTIYYLIFKYSGYRIGLIGIGVGFLGGLGAHYLSRKEGSKELAAITAILTVAGIILAQYLVAIGIWHNTVGEIEQNLADGGYSVSVTQAKEIIKAIPTGTDAEIKAYLIKQAVEDGDDAKSVTDQDVKRFRDKELPEYQDLASGKETKEQYFAKNNIDPNELKKVTDEGESTFKGVFLLLLLSKVGLISTIAAAGLAYRMTANA